MQWQEPSEEEWNNSIRLVINHFKEIKQVGSQYDVSWGIFLKYSNANMYIYSQVTWHGRGDYFASVMSDAGNRCVVIHQVSTRRSLIPFAKPKGLVQCVLFHPVKPFLFIAVSV